MSAEIVLMGLQSDNEWANNEGETALWQRPAYCVCRQVIFLLPYVVRESRGQARYQQHRLLMTEFDIFMRHVLIANSRHITLGGWRKTEKWIQWLFANRTTKLPNEHSLQQIVRRNRRNSRCL